MEKIRSVTGRIRNCFPPIQNLRVRGAKVTKEQQKDYERVFLEHLEMIQEVRNV